MAASDGVMVGLLPVLVGKDFFFMILGLNTTFIRKGSVPRVVQGT